MDSFFNTTKLTPKANVFMMFMALLNVLKKRKPMERQFMKTVDTTVELLSKINEYNIGKILANYNATYHKGFKVSPSNLASEK